MSSRRRRPLRIYGKFLLLVEGIDEVRFFCKLIENRVEDESIRATIQLIDAGGRDRFRNRFRAISTSLMERRDVNAIGIVRDADNSASSAFQSVRDSVSAVGYMPPSGHGVYSNSYPSIGIFIAPDGSNSGAIETLIRRSVDGSPAAECVSDYLECMEAHNSLLSRSHDKSFVHAYLSSMRDPMARVGEAAEQGVWDFNSSVFDSVSQFVSNLIVKLG